MKTAKLGHVNRIINDIGGLEPEEQLDHPVDLISLEEDNRFGNMLEREGYLRRVNQKSSQKDKI